MDKKYNVETGSPTWRLKMRKAYKDSDMEVPEKFKLPNQKAKSNALKKAKK